MQVGQANFCCIFNEIGLYCTQRRSGRQKQKLIVSPLKYFVTEMAAPTLNDYRNIVGVLQAAVCLCDSPALPQLHVVTSVMKVTLLSRAELFTWWPGGPNVPLSFISYVCQ